jgi:hypothetical protein
MWSDKLTGKLISIARTLLDCEIIFSRVLLLSWGVLFWNLVGTPDGLHRRMVDLTNGGQRTGRKN